MKKEKLFSLLRYIDNGSLECITSLFLITLSLTMPAIGLGNFGIQVIALSMIPLINVRFPVAALPLALVATVWLNAWADHLLLTGFIVYLAVEYATSRGRFALALILGVEWILIAYGVALERPLEAKDSPSLITEILLILVAAGTGAGRWKILSERKQRAITQQEIIKKIRTDIAHYLHDSMARSLAIMIVQSKLTELEPDPKKIQEKLNSIAKIGQEAVADLHQLVRHLVVEESAEKATAFGAWAAVSIHDTVNSAIQLLVDAGHVVSFDSRKKNYKLDHIAETAFALAFNEAVCNAIKHSPPKANVTIRITEKAQSLQILVMNPIGDWHANGESVIPGVGIGVESLTRRIRNIKGQVCVTSLQGYWKVVISLPLKCEDS